MNDERYCKHLSRQGTTHTRYSGPNPCKPLKQAGGGGGGGWPPQANHCH